MSKKSNNFPPLSAGQNFLTGGAVIRRLVRRAKIRPGDRVIEIGAGKGHITRELLRVGAEVTAYELDRSLAKRLCERFSGEKSLKVIAGDFLKSELPRSGDYKIFANIPFARTTEIMRHMCKAHPPPRQAWLIVERGAALRFCYHPPEWFARRYRAVMAGDVGREEFHPSPSCDAALLCLIRK